MSHERIQPTAQSDHKMISRLYYYIPACNTVNSIYNWGELERSPHDAVYGDFVCLSVMLSVFTYVHIPYIYTGVLIRR